MGRTTDSELRLSTGCHLKNPMIPFTKNKRQVFWLIVVLLLAVIGALSFKLKGHSPPGQGKAAAFWLAELIQSGGKSEEAKAALRRLGPEAVPYLIRELTRKSEIREEYVRAKVSLPIAVYNRLPRWHFPGWKRREYAALALGEIGPGATNAVSVLIEALDRFENEEFNRHPNSQGETTKGSQSFSPEARVQAVLALGKIAPHSRPVAVALIAALKQKDFSRRIVGDAAASVLAELNSEFKDLIPEMIENLRFQNKRQFRGSGLSAVYPLGSLAPGHEESVRPLIQALQDTDALVRQAAAYDLGTLRPQAKKAAKEAMPALLEALRDSDAGVRMYAAESILSIDPSQSNLTVSALINLLEDEDYAIRLRAVHLLLLIGSEAKAAVPALKSLLKDDAQVVRVWAKEALAEIEPQANDACPPHSASPSR